MKIILSDGQPVCMTDDSEESVARAVELLGLRRYRVLPTLEDLERENLKKECLAPEVEESEEVQRQRNREVKKVRPQGMSVTQALATACELKEGSKATVSDVFMYYTARAINKKGDSDV